MTESETPRVDLICILFMALEWIFFGSCHFVFRQLTVSQLPGWIPYQTFVIVVLGIVEVTAGILVIVPSTRKIASYTSLALLVVFIPAIYHILAVDSPGLYGGSGWQQLFRVILVPNNIFLSLCSIHLIRGKQTSSSLVALEKAIGDRPTDVRYRSAFVVALVMLTANVAGFITVWVAPIHLALGVQWGMMCLATGALMGFLFGVPKINKPSSKKLTYRPNSNIELISDWLTKMIIGVSLVEVRSIGSFLKRLSVDVGSSLSLNQSAVSRSAASSFALALIVYFFVAGAIQGYLLTRMYLSEEFAANETPPREPKSAQQVLHL